MNEDFKFRLTSKSLHALTIQKVCSNTVYIYIDKEIVFLIDATSIETFVLLYRIRIRIVFANFYYS